MTETQDIGEDPVLDALTMLSNVAASSTDDLASLNDELADMQQDRKNGRSWRHIISDTPSPNALSLLTTITTNFGRASGSFRRALALGLRQEGLQVTEVARLFAVSRQRVSALVRPREPGQKDPLEGSPEPR
jgi:predicted XRE-type DNA-binding protein